MDEQLITNATKIVEDNIGNEAYSVDDFCSALAMSRTSVHRKITAITGLSTTDFIRTIRLKRAAQLIKGRVASISEISFMVGFADVSYFSKCFKKEFGVTPTEFQS
jgi:AraC-like DNA-binding protein